MNDMENTNGELLSRLERLGALACPECKKPVRVQNDGIKCPDCGETYPIENDVPLFTYKQIGSKGTDTTEEKKTLHKIKKYTFLRKISRLTRVPSLQKITRGEDRLEYYLNKFSDNADAVIVDIGAGSKKWDNVIPLDLYNYPGIELCAKADKLPLTDNSVDMVISLTAVEHMIGVNDVFPEMERVLKPGGIMFITAPFLYPYHPEPFDLRRWTPSGIEDSLNNCSGIETGSVRGPFAGLYVILSSFFAWLFSFKNYPLYLGLHRLFRWLLLPLNIIDSLRGNYRKSTPLDSVIYYVGKKHDKDQEIASDTDEREAQQSAGINATA